MESHLSNSMTWLLPMAFCLPLIGVLGLAFIGWRASSESHAALQLKRVGTLFSGLYFSLGIALFALTADGRILVYSFADWSFPAAIVYVADRLSAMMVLLAGAASFLVHLLGPFDERASQRATLWCLLHGMHAGIHGAFLTGDVFNLFVAFEVFLILSYGLVLHACQDLRAIKLYLFINMIASSLLLIGAGFVYSFTGSLNMAELSDWFAGQSATNAPGIYGSLGFFLLFVVALMKAGAFPFFQWMPDTYSRIPAGLSAFFAALLTKVGIYVLIRIGVTVMPQQAAAWSSVLLVLGVLSIFIGVLSALGQMHMKRLLAFHTVSQIGYILVALALAFGPYSPLVKEVALAGAILFILHHGLVKSSLFALSTALDEASGTSVLGASTGYVSRLPWVAYLFFFSAVSLAGLPPSSGFFAKLYIVRALANEKEFWILGLLLFGSALTLSSMLKIWVNTMAGEVKNIVVSPSLKRLRTPLLFMVGASWVLVMVMPRFQVWLQSTAQQLMDRTPYVNEVKRQGQISREHAR